MEPGMALPTSGALASVPNIVLFYNLAPDGIDNHLRLMAGLRSRVG
jgi:hypothetical protein